MASQMLKAFNVDDNRYACDGCHVVVVLPCKDVWGHVEIPCLYSLWEPLCTSINHTCNTGTTQQHGIQKKCSALL